MTFSGQGQNTLQEEARAARRLLFLLVIATLVFLVTVFGGFFLHQKRVMRQNLEQRATVIGSYLVQLVTHSLHSNDGGTRCPVVSVLDQSNLPNAPVHVRILSDDGAQLDSVDKDAYREVKRIHHPVSRTHLAGGSRLVRYYQDIPIHPRCFSCHSPQSTAGNGRGVMVVDLLSTDTGELTAEIERFILSMGGLSALLFLGVIYVLGWRGMRQRLDALAEARYSSLIDLLTGLLNRHALVAEMDREIARMRRMETDLSFMVLDIDHFGSINKRFGRRMGDAVLKLIADTLRAELRSYDSVGRTGDKEFMVVLPQAPIDAALDVAERIRAAVAVNPVTLNGQQAPVSLSIGVVQADRTVEPVDVVLARLMSALANATANGGNRIETDDLFRIKP